MDKKTLKIKTLTTLLEKYSSKKVVLKEGTWAGPNTEDDRRKAKIALKLLKDWQTNYWNVLGDDELMNSIDAALSRGEWMLTQKWT